MAQMDITPIGTTAEVSALPLQSNYVEIVSKYNAHDIATTGVHGVTGTILSKQAIDALIDKHFPIGSIRLIWDNNITAIRNLLDTDKFRKLDGTKLEEKYSASVYYTKYSLSNLPNLDYAFFVGADTIVSTSTTAGANTINLTHTHTQSHTHSIASHLHTDGHRHTISNYASVTVCFRSDGQVFVDREAGSSFNPTDSRYFNGGTDGEVQTMTTSLKVMGRTNFTSTNVVAKAETTDTPYSYTNFTSSLSSTQDIRPKYCKIRAYVRVL